MPTTTYADLASSSATSLLPPKASDPMPLGFYRNGNLKFFMPLYSVQGTEATNDLVYMGDLPVGAIVLPQLSGIDVEVDPGVTFTVDVGDLTTSSRYASAIALGTAQYVALDETHRAAIYQVTSTTKSIYLKLTTVSTPSSLGKVRLYLAYIDPT